MLAAVKATGCRFLFRAMSLLEGVKWCGGVAQRESTSLTSKGSQVQSLSLPPAKPLKSFYFDGFFASASQLHHKKFRVGAGSARRRNSCGLRNKLTEVDAWLNLDL